MVEQSGWVDITDANPGHSAWYIERFRSMAAAGDDLAGEARFVDTLAPRRARILDAGCGPGRVAAFLSSLGHDVTGVDVDPILIEAAEHEHPGPTWLVDDLALLDLPSRRIVEPFDVIVSAGNVMTFLAPSTRRDVLANLCAHLAADGRMAIGFGADRGYEFDDFRADAAAAGLVVQLEFASWDLRPFTDESDYLVAVLAADPRRRNEP